MELSVPRRIVRSDDSFKSQSPKTGRTRMHTHFGLVIPIKNSRLEKLNTDRPPTYFYGIRVIKQLNFYIKNK